MVGVWPLFFPFRTPTVKLADEILWPSCEMASLDFLLGRDIMCETAIPHGKTWNRLPSVGLAV